MNATVTEPRHKPSARGPGWDPESWDPKNWNPGRIVEEGVSPDDRTYCVIMHLTLLGHLILPGVAAIAPLIMWQSKKEKSAFIDDHGREALNFHLTIILYSVVLPIITVILGVITLGIGLIALPFVAVLPYVLGIVGMILAVMATNRDEYYRYPMCIRMIQG